MCNRLVDIWCWSLIESTLSLFSNLFQLLDRTCFKTFDIFKIVSCDPNWNWKPNCPKLLVVVLALIKVGPLLMVFHQGMQNLCKTVNISFGLYGTRTGIEPGKWYFSKIRCFLQSLPFTQSKAAGRWVTFLFFLTFDHLTLESPFGKFPQSLLENKFLTGFKYYLVILTVYHAHSNAKK